MTNLLAETRASLSGATRAPDVHALAPAVYRALKAEPAAVRNRWKRRAAAVALVYEAKRGRSTERILEVAELLIGDADDMVRKGLGWLLKETYPKKPREVVRFLLAHPAAPRLVIRYAAEKMNAPAPPKSNAPHARASRAATVRERWLRPLAKL